MSVKTIAASWRSSIGIAAFCLVIFPAKNNVQSQVKITVSRAGDLQLIGAWGAEQRAIYFKIADLGKIGEVNGCTQ